MANYQQILDVINQNIKQNGNEEITGKIMNNVLKLLLEFINGQTKGYNGVLTTQTKPNNQTSGYWFALEGVYNYFGVSVPENNLGIVYWKNNKYVVDLIDLVDEEAIKEYIDQQLININLGFGGEITDLNQSPTIEGMYIPKLIGVYPNFNNLEKLETDGFVMFLFKDGVFSKINIPLDINIEDEVKNNSLDAVNGKAVEKYAVKKINTITDLRNTNGEYEGQIITLLGYYESGDKEPLNYKWTLTQGVDDGGSIINSGDGSWVALFSYSINIKHFGAICNGISFDDTQIENTINYISKRPYVNLTNGEMIGGGIVLFPEKVHIENTIILKKGVSIQGVYRRGTNLHCKNQIIAISNLEGFEPDGDIINSNQFFIRDLSITQGGIQIKGGSNVIIKDITILNIGNITGIEFSLFVNILLDNVKIVNFKGKGLHLTDNLGSGPSTTFYATQLYITQGNECVVIDGNQGGSHCVMTTSFHNLICEYSKIGLKTTGFVENIKFDNLHFEQLEKPIELYDQYSISFNNVWTDLGTIILYAGLNQNDNVVSFNQIKGELLIQFGYTGQVFTDGTATQNNCPETCLMHNKKGNIITSSFQKSLRPTIGYTSFDTLLNKVITYNGTNWIDSNGVII